MWRCIFFLILGGVIFGCTGVVFINCINQEEINDLTIKNEMIISQLDYLNQAVFTLENNYSVLQAKYNDAIADLESDSQTILELEESLSTTQASLDSANARIDELVYELNSTDPVFGKYVDGSLTEVKAEDLKGITEIRDYAFANSVVTSIEIPEGVTSIGDNAFASCNFLENISLPSSLRTIGSTVFYKLPLLESLTIPEGVVSLGDRCINTCEALVNLSVPSSLESLGQNALYGLSATLNEDSVGGGSYYGNESNPYVVFIQPVDSALTSINVVDGCRLLNDSSFSTVKSTITNVTLPESLVFIGKQVFASCSALTSVNMPEGLNYLGSHCFQGCSSLKSIDLTCNIETIDTYTFNNCTSLSTVIFPKGLKTIGRNAFYNAGITELNLPEGLIEIAENCFMNCKALTSAYIPSTAFLQGGSNFAGCSSLVDVTLLANNDVLPGTLFSNCTALRHIVIPSTCTSIGSNVFNMCTSLTSVYIPKSVVTISGDGTTVYSIFRNANSAVQIYCEAESKPEGFNDNWNYAYPSTTPLSVTWGVTLEEYKALIA